MVLTEQELVLAINKSQKDRRIRSALFTRRKTINFSEQTACDREIQRYLGLKGTLVYKFNCCIIHQPWRFNQIPALSDHGWDEFGPTNERLHAIYRTLSFYPESNRTATIYRDGEINNLNRRTNSISQESRVNNNLVIDYDSDAKCDAPSWGARLLSCIFA